MFLCNDVIFLHVNYVSIIKSKCQEKDSQIIFTIFHVAVEIDIIKTCDIDFTQRLCYYVKLEGCCEIACKNAISTTKILAKLR